MSCYIPAAWVCLWVNVKALLHLFSRSGRLQLSVCLCFCSWCHDSWQTNKSQVVRPSAGKIYTSLHWPSLCILLFMVRIGSHIIHY